MENIPVASPPGPDHKKLGIGLIVGALIVLAIWGVFKFIGSHKNVAVSLNEGAAKEKTTDDHSEKGKHDNSRQIQRIGQINADITSDVAKKTVSPDQKDKIVERRKLIEGLLADGDPTALSLVLSSNIRSKLPTDQQADIEKPITLSASITTTHLDDFQHKTDSFAYRLDASPGVNYEYHPLGTEVLVRSGSKVQVNGFIVGSKVFSATDSKALKVVSQPKAIATGPQKMLAVLLNFQDSPPVPYTPEQAKTYIFGDQMQKFYAEASYGQMSWTGDVTSKWYTIPKPMPTTSDRSSCGLVQFIPDNPDGDDVYKLIKNDIDVKQYSTLVFMVNTPCYGGGGTVGKTSVSIGGVLYPMGLAWVNTGSNLYTSPWGNHPFTWRTTDLVLAHELGHTLGVMHANAWGCPSGQLYGDCNHYEYGDFFDVMGNGSYALHFNSYFKDVFGWTTGRSNTIQTSGTYTLNPLENGDGIVSAHIVNPAIPNASFYSLEYRQATGFDANLGKSPQSVNQNGLIIDWVPKEYSPTVRILDEDTTQGESYALPVGTTYADAGRGISITAVGATSKEITYSVDIKNPVCVQNNPLVTLWNSYQSAKPGTTYYVGYTFADMDSPTCPSSSIEISADVPSGWILQFPNGHSFSMDSDGLNPLYSSITVAIPSGVPDGSYTVFLHFKNVVSGITTTRTSTFSIQTATPTPKPSPTPTITSTPTGTPKPTLTPTPSPTSSEINVSRGYAAQLLISRDGRKINTAGGPHFFDVPTKDPNYSYIETIYLAGITAGCATNPLRYCPTTNITRAQFLTLVVKDKGYALINPSKPTFTDVPTTSIYYKFIETAYAQGLIAGYGDGTFHPDAMITRTEANAILNKAFPKYLPLP